MKLSVALVLALCLSGCVEENNRYIKYGNNGGVICHNISPYDGIHLDMEHRGYTNVIVDWDFKKQAYRGEGYAHGELVTQWYRQRN